MADQRLAQMKKFYEDNLVETSKEAADRVMAAERKVRFLEDELKAATAESRQKIREAHTANEKIEELEGQLDEAETIVVNLREELRSVGAENVRLMQHLAAKDGIARQSVSTSSDGRVDKILSSIVLKRGVGKDGILNCWYELQQPTHDELAPEPAAVATAERPPLPPPVLYTFQRKRKTSRSGGGQSTSSAGGKSTQEPAEKPSQLQGESAHQPHKRPNSKAAGNTSEEDALEALVHLSKGLVIFGDQERTSRDPSSV